MFVVQNKKKNFFTYLATHFHLLRVDGSSLQNSYQHSITRLLLVTGAVTLNTVVQLRTQ